MILCSFGLSSDLYQERKSWLDEDPQNRLIFVEDREIEQPTQLLEDSRVRFYSIESPLQVEKFANKIAWEAVFLPLQIVNQSGSPLFDVFKQALEFKHTAALLQLSDAADWGCSLASHAKKNLARPFRSILDLKNAFQDIPAIVVGAGPSLEKNGHLLASFQSKAILFAGGHALEKIPCRPHFGALIDKVRPLASLPFPDVPLCFQARMHPDNFVLSEGEALLAPDSHFSFLNFLSGDRELFDGGWTVGNFSAALAVYFGCHPIVSVGMDYCYRKGKKYAFDQSLSVEGLIQVEDRFGNTVGAQSDWVMAISWMEDLAKRHPDKTFLNATEGGMKFWPSCRLDELDFPDLPKIQETIDFAIAKLKIRPPPRIEEWKEMLLTRNEDLDDQLLLPLWKIWEPIFAREMDRNHLSFEEKMKLHKMIFLDQVTQEHLDAVC